MSFVLSANSALNYKAACIAIFAKKKLIRNLLQQNVNATDQRKFTYDLLSF